MGVFHTGVRKITNDTLLHFKELILRNENNRTKIIARLPCRVEILWDIQKILLTTTYKLGFIICQYG